MKHDIRIRNGLILLYAVLFVLSVLMTVLAFLPERSDIEVKDAFTVSASINSVQSGSYILDIEGTLRNTTDEPILLEKVTVSLKGMDREFVLNEKPEFLEPRTTVKFACFEESETAAEVVGSVTVTANGKTSELRNPAVQDTLSHTVLPLLASVVFLVLLLHSAIVRYYLAQESKLPQEESRLPVCEK